MTPTGARPSPGMEYHMSTDTPAIKSFPAAVLLTLTCGKSLNTGMGAFHEAAEHIVGHPIWTHEFASAGLWAKLREATIKAAPSLVPEGVALADSITSENALDVIAEIERRYPNPIPVRRGTDERTESPMASLKRIKPDAEVIVVDPTAQQTVGEA